MDDRKQLHELLRLLAEERDASKVYKILEDILHLMQAKRRDQKINPLIDRLQPHTSDSPKKSKKRMPSDHPVGPQNED